MASGIAIATSWITGIEWIMLVAAVIAATASPSARCRPCASEADQHRSVVVTAAVGAVLSTITGNQLPSPSCLPWVRRSRPQP